MRHHRCGGQRTAFVWVLALHLLGDSCVLFTAVYISVRIVMTSLCGGQRTAFGVGPGSLPSWRQSSCCSRYISVQGFPCIHSTLAVKALGSQVCHCT